MSEVTNAIESGMWLVAIVTAIVVVAGIAIFVYHAD
jgi:hypothetical protein